MEKEKENSIFRCAIATYFPAAAIWPVAADLKPWQNIH